MALEEDERGLLTLRWDPVWDDLRRDERFKELVRESRPQRPPMIRREPSGRRGRGNSPANSPGNTPPSLTP